MFGRHRSRLTRHSPPSSRPDATVRFACVRAARASGERVLGPGAALGRCQAAALRGDRAALDAVRRRQAHRRRAVGGRLRPRRPPRGTSAPTSARLARAPASARGGGWAGRPASGCRTGRPTRACRTSARRPAPDTTQRRSVVISSWSASRSVARSRRGERPPVDRLDPASAAPRQKPSERLPHVPHLPQLVARRTTRGATRRSRQPPWPPLGPRARQAVSAASRPDSTA